MQSTSSLPESSLVFSAVDAPSGGASDSGVPAVEPPQVSGAQMAVFLLNSQQDSIQNRRTKRYYCAGFDIKDSETVPCKKVISSILVASKRCGICADPTTLQGDSEQSRNSHMVWFCPTHQRHHEQLHKQAGDYARKFQQEVDYQESVRKGHFHDHGGGGNTAY